ncbi:MAG: SPOR domain-containing protein [Myxococcota bacterium]
MTYRFRSPSLRFATTVALAAGVCAGGLGYAGAAAADEYSVQIGAFERPDPNFAAAAEEIGKLYQSRNVNGVTRIQIGRYGSLEEANVALRALNGAGYTDAYVVNKSARLSDSVEAGQLGQTTSRSSRTAAITSTRSRRDESALMANVPDELRGRTVLLDGRLHVMEGNRFIPLRAYLNGSR